jgi:hypothetical protein
MDRTTRAKLESDRAAKKRLAALHSDEQLRRDVERACEEVQRGERGTPWADLKKKR